MFGKNWKAQSFLARSVKSVLVSSSLILMSLAGASFADNLSVNGANRNMIVYAPSGIEKGRPLLISCHGMNQDAAYQKNQAKWEEIADTAKFVVVYPNGENKGWDISGQKDINFVLAIIEEMSKRYSIDRNRVYLSGFSMGGMFCYHAINNIADKIAAFAPVSGYSMGGNSGKSARPVPIIHHHGTSDDVVNYSGAKPAVETFAKAFHCKSNAVKTTPVTLAAGNKSYAEVWSDCDDGVSLELVTLDGKGHWHSNDNAAVHTSKEIWNFIKNYSLDGGSITPPVIVPTNRDSIFNGGFDSTAVAWDLQLHGDAQATGNVTKGKYELEISAIGTENYQVQLIQHDLHLEKGQWYEVSFDASAGASRTLEVNVEQHVDPWASYLKEKQNFDIGKESKTYSFKFEMTAATDTNGRLSFNAGSSMGTLSLDNVKLKKIEAPADTGNVKMILVSKKYLRTSEASFEVYNLAGERMGAVKLDGQNIQSVMESAGFGKGVYILRSKNRSFMVPLTR